MTGSTVFADVDFGEALARSKRDRKVLVVDATATWCGPCQMMERTTWSDPGVSEYFTAHGIIGIQIDVDAKQDVARQLRIQSMPTLIAFKDGEEFDRVVGAHGARQLIEWLEAVARGEKSLEEKRARVVENPTDIRARLTHARALVQAGKLDDATTEHVWLWEHMLEHDPAFHGVRLSFFVGDLSKLARMHPPAREAIARLRDAVSPDRILDASSLVEWVALNEALDDNARTIAWYDGPSRPPRLPVGVTRRLAEMLLAAERWADAGALISDPIADIANAAALREKVLHPRLPPEAVEEVRGVAAKYLRDTATKLVRALRAAGRAADADAVIAEATKHDPSAFDK